MTFKAQLAVLLAMTLAGLAYALLSRHDAKVAAVVESKIVQRAEKKGALNAAKSKKVHDAARVPGAVDRLRQDRQSCPDCN